MKRRGQDPGWRQQAAERLDQVLALPILVLTVVFLAVLVLPVIHPDVPAASRAGRHCRWSHDLQGGAWLPRFLQAQLTYLE